MKFNEEVVTSPLFCKRGLTATVSYIEFSAFYKIGRHVSDDDDGGNRFLWKLGRISRVLQKVAKCHFKLHSFVPFLQNRGDIFATDFQQLRNRNSVYIAVFNRLVSFSRYP